MKPLGNILRDVVKTEFSGLEPSHSEADLVASLKASETPAEAQARLRRTGRAEGNVAEKIDYAEIARSRLELSKQTGREARIAWQLREQSVSRRRAKTALALTTLEHELPPRHRGYVTERPARTVYNQAARDLVAQLRLGRSVHLYGSAGTTKTHLAVWVARCLIKRYGVRVRYLNKTSLQRLAYDFNNPPNFLDAEIILFDDLDKVDPGNFTSPAITTLLGRPELGLTLISTAQRPLEQIALRYEPDELNRQALCSRLFYVREVEVSGPDFRPYDAERRWPS